MPVAATEKVAACPAVTDCAIGCKVIAGAMIGAVTVSSAELLVAVPEALLTATVKCVPLSVTVVMGVE